MYPNLNPECLLALQRAIANCKSDEDRELLLELHMAHSRAQLVFKCSIPGRFVVTDPGDTEETVVLRCDILAAAGAHLAIANSVRHDLVRVADFAEPGIANPERSVRAGLKRFAKVLEAAGQRALASAVLQVRIRGGYLVVPRNKRWDFVTE